MKLAEALLLRADQQTKLARLRERIAREAVVQEGDKPKEDPVKMLREAAGVLDDLTKLVVQINLTNVREKVADGRSLMKAIAERERLKQHASLLHAACDATDKDPDRYGMSEIRWVPVIDVAKMQKQADDVSKKIREINAMIQEANWRIELDGEGD